MYSIYQAKLDVEMESETEMQIRRQIDLYSQMYNDMIHHVIGLYKNDSKMLQFSETLKTFHGLRPSHLRASLRFKADANTMQAVNDLAIDKAKSLLYECDGLKYMPDMTYSLGSIPVGRFRKECGTYLEGSTPPWSHVTIKGVTGKMGISYVGQKPTPKSKAIKGFVHAANYAKNDGQYAWVLTIICQD